MSEKIEDPLAFPVSTIDGFTQHGMTLRQWYMGQALAGLCANPGGPFQANAGCGWNIVNCDHDDIARECGNLADAVLRESMKGQTP